MGIIGWLQIEAMRKTSQQQLFDRLFLIHEASIASAMHLEERLADRFAALRDAAVAEHQRALLLGWEKSRPALLDAYYIIDANLSVYESSYRPDLGLSLAAYEKTFRRLRTQGGIDVSWPIYDPQTQSFKSYLLSATQDPAKPWFQTSMTVATLEELAPELKRFINEHSDIRNILLSLPLGHSTSHLYLSKDRSSKSTLLQQTFKLEEEARRWANRGPVWLGKSLMLSSKLKHGGVAAVVVDGSTLTELERQSKLYFDGLVLVILGVFAIGSLYLTHFVVQPLRRLARAMVERKPIEAPLSQIHELATIEIEYGLMLERIADERDYLETKASTDALTGVLNKGAILEAIKTKIAAKKPWLLAVCDIDHFKKLNDTYGHLAGDKGIVALANHLRKAFRESDLIGRFGGEEFFVLLDGITIEQARQRFTSLIEKLKTSHFEHERQHIGFTISVGIAAWREGMDLDAIIGAADAALYQAKEKGRARVEIAI